MAEDKRILNEEALGEVAGGVSRSNLPVIRHTVVKGDTLDKLAQQYGTSVERIMQLNPIIKDKSRIDIGWVLTIPDGWK